MTWMTNIQTNDVKLPIQILLQQRLNMSATPYLQSVEKDALMEQILHLEQRQSF